MSDRPNIARGRNVWRDLGKPRRYRTDNTCKGKRYFADEIAARAAGLVSIEERANTSQLWVYRCPSCSGWHLTSQRKSDRWLVSAGPSRRAA